MDAQYAIVDEGMEQVNAWMKQINAVCKEIDPIIEEINAMMWPNYAMIFLFDLLTIKKYAYIADTNDETCELNPVLLIFNCSIWAGSIVVCE